MAEHTEGRGVLPRLWALLRQRCPRCFRGAIFARWMQMNDPCPVCGQLFQREEGYFLGAMYVSYALGCGLVSAGYFTLMALWPNLSSLQICLILLGAYVPLMPVIFRYSRVIFLHLDYLVSSGSSSAGVYEKLRSQQTSRTTRNP